MFSNDRAQMRGHFIEAWRRHREGRVLTALEAQIVEIVGEHPEYHALLEASDAAQRQFDAQANPFLHLSLHLALREQRETDRPPGIRAALGRLARKTGGLHQAEHAAMPLLQEALGGLDTDRDGARYLAALRRAVR